MERSPKMEISNLLAPEQMDVKFLLTSDETPQLPPPESVLREIMRTYEIKDEKLAKAILAFGRKLFGDKSKRDNTEYLKKAIQKVVNGTFFTKPDYKEFNKILSDYYISKPNIGPVEFANQAIGILRKHANVRKQKSRGKEEVVKSEVRREKDRRRKRLAREKEKRERNNEGSSSNRPRSHRGGSSPDRGGSSKRGRHN